MKKTLVAFLFAILLYGCGVGSYSVSSGKAGEGAISFTTVLPMDITVTVDKDSYDISSVAAKTWKTGRDIKQTAKNTIKLSPGTHTVKVNVGGTEVFSKVLFISSSEHRVIEL